MRKRTKSFYKKKKGPILVTGPAGSGKSSKQAAPKTGATTSTGIERIKDFIPCYLKKILQ